MTQMENKLVELSGDIGVVNAEKVEITNKAFESYRSVKSTLRITRNELKRLADKTIRTTGDLILYMEAWDSEKYSAEKQKEYLKEQATILRELVTESKQIS